MTINVTCEDTTVTYELGRATAGAENVVGMVGTIEVTRA